MLSPVLGPYPQLSQVPHPVWQVPEDEERPLVGKGMCAHPGPGAIAGIPRSAWGTGMGRGIGAEVPSQRAGGDRVCTLAEVCGDPEGARIPRPRRGRGWGLRDAS